MSTTAEFIDGAQFEEGIRSVRDDATADRYIVVKHKDGDPHQVEVLTVGQNTEEIGQLMEDSQVMYTLARYETKFDMSNTIKFVYFRWVGDKVPVVKKGRYGVVHGSIEEKFRPYHVMVETSNVEDFDDAKIIQQLETTAGTKSMVLESTEGRQERGFTATQLPQRSQANKNTVSVSKDGAHFEVLPMVYDDIAAVRDNNNPTRWMLASYHNMDPRGPIISVAKGEGDLDELKKSLEVDKAMYALYRVTDKVDDIVTTKFVYITWVGNSVKPMTKAKLSTHKGTAETVFGPAHVKVFANDLSDITERSVMDKVMSASGTASHVK